MDEELGKELNVLKGHTDWVLSCNFSPCGNFIVSGSEDKTIKIWDVYSGNLVKTLEGHTGWVYSCNFSPYGNFIVSGSGDDTIRVWKGLDEPVLIKFAGKTT